MHDLKSSDQFNYCSKIALKVQMGSLLHANLLSEMKPFKGFYVYHIRTIWITPILVLFNIFFFHIFFEACKLARNPSSNNTGQTQAHTCSTSCCSICMCLHAPYAYTPYKCAMKSKE